MKRLRLVVGHSSYGGNKLTLSHPEGGSIRDAISEAGFEFGDRVVVLLESEAEVVRRQALNEAADLVHAAAVGADAEVGGAIPSLCLSLAERAIRALVVEP